MSVDLRSNSAFKRTSLLVTDDSLVQLEHGRNEDRVRKFMFDSTESVVIWRTWPYVRMTIVTLCFVVPGGLLQLSSEVALNVIGGILLALGLSLDLFYAVCRSTTIRLICAGKPHTIKGIFRPKKVRLLRDKLLAGIRQTQSARPETNPAAPPALPTDFAVTGV